MNVLAMNYLVAFLLVSAVILGPMVVVGTWQRLTEPNPVKRVMRKKKLAQRGKA